MLLFYYFRILVVISTIFFIYGCTTNQLNLRPNKITSKFKNAHILKGNYELLNFLKPYRINVQQGNCISKEMIMQLKKGMTRHQVQFLLGTSLLLNTFYAHCWNYQFSFVQANGDFLTSRVSIFFKHDLLDYYKEENMLPTEQEYLSLIKKR